jgi:hypothetical protein
MFRLKYARSAFIDAVFFFRGNSKRKDNAGARNKGAPLENALAALYYASASASSSCPYCPFYCVAITTSFFRGICLSLISVLVKL